jgi:glycosidase
VISPVPDWEDVAGLDYKNPELRKYMVDMLKYWLRDFDLDGFRCDAASMVPMDFWNEARRELEKVKPGIIVIAEANDAGLFQAFDLDYAWPFHSTLTDVFENGAPASALKESWQKTHEQYPKDAMEMRFSDDHDEKRAIVRFGERGALAASALVFTMDGVPALYNGMEVGDTAESGAPALFEKLPVLWQIEERRPEFPKFYTQIIALRHAHAALQQGATEWVGNSDQNRVLTFFRRGGGEEFLVAVNCSSRPFFGTIEASGQFDEVTPEGNRFKTATALPAASLEAWGFRIWKKR